MPTTWVLSNPWLQQTAELWCARFARSFLIRLQLNQSVRQALQTFGVRQLSTSALRWRTLLFLLAMPVWASAQRDSAARVRALAGCWTTEVETFRTVAATPVDSILTNVPPMLRLDTLPGRSIYNEPFRWLLRAIPKASGSSYRDGYYAPFSVDSVALDWTNGFAGLSIRARESGGTMGGVATAWTDSFGEMRAPVTLRRVACP